MTQFLRLNVKTANRDQIHQCAAALAAGEAVTLPDLSGLWTVQVHSAFTRPATVTGDEFLLLHSAEAFADFAPAAPPAEQRFARKGWPGQTILATDSLIPDLRKRVGVCAETVRVFVLSHWFSQSVFELIPEIPRVLEWTSRGHRQHFGPSLVPRIHVSDDSLTEVCPAHIQFQSRHWTIVDPGDHSLSALLKMAGRLFLFVCTGNTCRSPMAERLFSAALSERLDCAPDELGKHGFYVASAGLAAPPAYPASVESVNALQRRGLNLSDHLSQQLTQELLDQADSVFTMTQSHRQTILRARPDVADRVHTLTSDNVVDPIGGTADDYESCCQQIDAGVRQIVEALSLPSD